MNQQLIKAHLNLYAVLQNLEDLVRLDPAMAELTAGWNITIQFSVLRGPSAYLAFENGACTHGAGAHPSPTVKLLFTSPDHLNRMFAGSGMPIPLKGFRRLGFISREFPKLTERLEDYLRPKDGALENPAFFKTNTTLTLYTAAFAVKELALLEPECRQIAASVPQGTLQLGVLPNGPHVYLVFGDAGIRVAKGNADNPMAKMTFNSIESAHELLNGRLNAFSAVAEREVFLNGQIPMIDSVGLILDRVEQYLA